MFDTLQECRTAIVRCLNVYCEKCPLNELPPPQCYRRLMYTTQKKMGEVIEAIDKLKSISRVIQKGGDNP